MAKRYDKLLRLLLVGDTGVGKTCLICQYACNEFHESHLTTIGVDFKMKLIDLHGRKVKVQIWDTAGQERFEAITKQFFIRAQGCVLVFDISSRSSFESLGKWMLFVKRENVENSEQKRIKLDKNKEEEVSRLKEEIYELELQLKKQQRKMRKIVITNIIDKYRLRRTLSEEARLQSSKQKEDVIANFEGTLRDQFQCGVCREVVIKLSAHPEFSSANHSEMAEIKRRVKKVFPIAEEIKSKLKKRYTEEEHIYKEQQRRLAAERAAQEEERRKALEEQQKQDEELARKLQEEEEAEIKSLQEEKYRKLRMQEEEKLKYEQRKKQALDAGAPLVVHNGGTFDSGIAVADAAPAVAPIDVESVKYQLPGDSHSEIAAIPPPPSYSEYLSEIAISPPQIPDRELKKKMVISDINVPPTQAYVPVIDRSKKPFNDHHMSLGEYGGMKAGQLRNVIIPSSLMSKFLSAAAENTSRESETMGILCGKVTQGMFKIKNLFIPQQKGGHDSCDMENEEELIAYQDNHNLITLGWIHTHPTQTAFLSSVDLHSHFPWQKMMPEAIAIVCSPKYEETGIFKLTDHGLDVIGSCKQKGFHPHSKEPPLFETCGHVQISDRDTVEVENKMK